MESQINTIWESQCTPLSWNLSLCTEVVQAPIHLSEEDSEHPEGRKIISSSLSHVSGPQKMLNKCLKEKGKGGVQVDTRLDSLRCNQAQCAGSFFSQPSSTLRYRMEEKAKVKEEAWSLNTVVDTFISLTEAPALTPQSPHCAT